MFDKQLLCIDCILSDAHKNANGERHDLSAVDKAAKIEKDQLDARYQ